MANLEWWMYSPSPFSLAFYLLLVIFGAWQLHKRRTFKRWNKLMALTESFFLVAFVVLLTDLIWIIACGLRFGASYPNSILQLVICALRNIAGLIGISYFVDKHFKSGLVKVTSYTTMLFYVNLAFLAIWFLASPSPAFTDWTFAIKYGYPSWVITSSFLTSHVIGKSIVGLLYYSLWR